jgi:hypothetical protein
VDIHAPVAGEIQDDDYSAEADSMSSVTPKPCLDNGASLMEIKQQGESKL